MDDRSPFAYIASMRLLLLLSALLSALTGVGGSRAASAQPVATSVCVAGQAALAQARKVVEAEAAPATRFSVADAPPWRLAVPPLHPAYPLYADRLRE